MLSKTSRVFLSALAASWAAASPIESAKANDTILDLANSTEIAPKRDSGTGASLLAGAITAIWKGSLPQPLACDDNFNDTPYTAVLKAGVNGQYVLVCWANDQDTVEWDQGTADAAKCLTNLHYTQADTCISVAGSSCDNGYVSGGGRLQNLREPIWGSGTQSDAQISADASATIQVGIEALLGQQVRGTYSDVDQPGPYFLVTNSDGTEMASPWVPSMQVNWIGQQAC